MTTARIAFRDDADISWRVETAASLVPLLRTDAFWGAPADWAPCAPAADPLKGETSRARVLTLTTAERRELGWGVGAAAAPGLARAGGRGGGERGGGGGRRGTRVRWFLTRLYPLAFA